MYTSRCDRPKILLSTPTSNTDRKAKGRMLTIVRNGQPFLGVNVPHLDCWVELAEGGELSMSGGSNFGLELLVERNCTSRDCASLRAGLGLA